MQFLPISAPRAPIVQLSCHRRSTKRRGSRLEPRLFERSGSHVSMLGGNGGTLDDLSIDLNIDLIADQHTTGLQRYVPVQIEVLAINRGGNRKSGTPITLHVLGLAVECRLQHDSPGHAMQRKISLDTVLVLADLFHFGTLERRSRVLLGLKEVGA